MIQCWESLSRQKFDKPKKKEMVVATVKLNNVWKDGGKGSMKSRLVQAEQTSLRPVLFFLHRNCSNKG